MKIETCYGEVTIRECWDCCNGINECGSSLEISDENGEVIGEMVGYVLPDEPDDEFIEMVESAIEDYEMVNC